MDIHDFATLLVLAAQHPGGCIHTQRKPTDRNWYDHAACIEEQMGTEDVRVIFVTQPEKWRVCTTSPRGAKAPCSYCASDRFEPWPEELTCASTTA